MKRLGWIVAVALALSSCATSRPVVKVACDRETALARGQRDGASGKKASFSFLKRCTADTRALALSVYREGFEATRPKKKLEKEEPIEVVEDDSDAGDAEEISSEAPANPMPLPVAVPSPVREPSAVSWVCEVEANAKVFTGVGVTRDEALGSARSNCGAHFQASYCTKADCKQNL